MDEFTRRAMRTRDEVLLSLPPLERALVLDTRWRIQALPDSYQMNQAGVKEGDLLLGLYTSPPPTITIFRENVLRSGKSVSEVVRHELGHRLGLNHVLEQMRHYRACGILGSCAAAYVT